MKRELDARGKQITWEADFHRITHKLTDKLPYMTAINALTT